MFALATRVQRGAGQTEAGLNYTQNGFILYVPNKQVDTFLFGWCEMFCCPTFNVVKQLSQFVVIFVVLQLYLRWLENYL